MTDLLAEEFLLDPDVIFLNHGSFGATPKPVFAEYQRLQREMERQPVLWLGRRVDDLLAAARAKLAAFVGAQADDLVFFPNPTTAVNMVARSLRLQPGDEVLTTDHEYGAMDRTWRLVCSDSGARYVQVAIPLPVAAQDDFIERVWSGVTERTKALFLSHLTSATALLFPVDELCRRAREAGILTIVDGAHVPGHMPLDIEAIGCDVYTGALHKWLCAPKGASFLWATPAVQAWLRPLVVSWGWESDHPSSSQFIDHHQWQGTRDVSAFLSVGAAIDFQQSNDWPTVQAEGARLALMARDRVDELTGLPPISPDGAGWLGQMTAIRLPSSCEVAVFKQRLYDEFRVEAPVHRWNDQPFIRVSCTAYNNEGHIDGLVSAVGALLGSG